MASPTKSTIHQAFSKSPPILQNPEAIMNELDRRSSQALSLQIRQNKERLRRLLNDEGKFEARFARQSRLKSASSN